MTGSPLISFVGCRDDAARAKNECVGHPVRIMLWFVSTHIGFCFRSLPATTFISCFHLSPTELVDVGEPSRCCSFVSAPQACSHTTKHCFVNDGENGCKTTPRRVHGISLWVGGCRSIHSIQDVRHYDDGEYHVDGIFSNGTTISRHVLLPIRHSVLLFWRGRLSQDGSEA